MFGLCLLAMSLTDLSWSCIVAMLAAVAVSSLCGYLDKWAYVTLLCAAYTLLCFFIFEFVIFLPLIAYDFISLEKRVLRFMWIIALPVCFVSAGWRMTAVVVFSAAAAVMLHFRTTSQMKTQTDFFALTDDAKERAELLEHKNRELMEKQDYEVRLATLAERNRIAREIHDNVGHLLTRSILQIDALRVTCSSDSTVTNELEMIKSTMTDAMDSIRSSVHDLHDESISLKTQLEKLIEGFKFCPVRLRYDADYLPTDFRVCFSAVSKEALSNIARHSNATEAAITVTEHPAFCQLVIWDNGTKQEKPIAVRGIGLENMAQRVNALGGIFRTDNENGFRIFISIPKEKG